MVCEDQCWFSLLIHSLAVFMRSGYLATSWSTSSKRCMLSPGDRRQGSSGSPHYGCALSGSAIGRSESGIGAQMTWLRPAFAFVILLALFGSTAEADPPEVTRAYTAEFYLLGCKD